VYCVAFLPQGRANAYRIRTSLPGAKEFTRLEHAWNEFDKLLFGSKSNGILVLYQYSPGMLIPRVTRTRTGKKRRKPRPLHKKPWITLLAQAVCVGR
jgi:hypothetical protein